MLAARGHLRGGQGMGVACSVALLAGCDLFLANGAPIAIEQPGWSPERDGGLAGSDAPLGRDTDPAAVADAGTDGNGLQDGSILVQVDGGAVLVADGGEAGAGGRDGALLVNSVEVPWVAWPEQTAVSDGRWGSVLTDVMQHAPPDEVYYADDLITQAHETLHGIDIHINLERTDWTGWSSFYSLDDRSITLPEPAIRKSQVAPYIPAPFRGSRYDLYVVNQTDWDDHPLYLWEEWNAYLIGTATGVDLATSGLWNGGWRDACMGTLEFVGYGIGVGRAVEALDPGYLSAQPAAAAWLGFMLQRSLDRYRACAVLPDFAWGEQDALYQLLRTGEPGEPLRAFVRRTFGDAFVDEVLALEP